MYKRQRHGKTLESFQYMFTLLLNNRLGFRYPVMIDVEGYKNRRRQKLESIAHSSANKALSRHCEVRMHPMKPYERRIVHLTLRNVSGITTHSEGADVYKRQITNFIGVAPSFYYLRVVVVVGVVETPNNPRFSW